MMQVLETLIDRNRIRMNVGNLKTILGRKPRPLVKKRKKLKPWQVTVERPGYDLTVCRVHCEEFALKIYNKGERVVRVEAMTRNASVLKCGRSLGSTRVGALTSTGHGFGAWPDRSWPSLRLAGDSPRLNWCGTFDLKVAPVCMPQCRSLPWTGSKGPKPRLEVQIEKSGKAAHPSDSNGVINEIQSDSRTLVNRVPA